MRLGEFNPRESLSPDIDTYIKHLIERLEVTRKVVKENIEDCNFVTKAKYDRDAMDPDRYQLGDTVLLYDPTNKKGQCPKFKQRWTGPYTVVDRSKDGILYKLKNSETAKEIKAFVHFNRIKPYTVARDTFLRTNVDKTNVGSDEQSGNNESKSTADLGNGWFKIDRICGKKKVNGKIYFLVRWSDGTKSYEPRKNVTDYAINQYLVRTKQKQKRKNKSN